MPRNSYPNCPICRSAASYLFATKFARVANCENPGCGHLFALDPEQNRGIHEHEESNVQMYTRRNEVLIRQLLTSGLVHDCARVLDVGAGLGHISSELKRQASGVEIVCVEAAPASVRHLREIGFEVFEDLSEMISGGKFDFMFIVELIEHVDDPVGLMTRCRHMLNPGGRIFLTTPSGELRNGSHDTAAYQIPEHVQFFTERSLGNLAVQSGFGHLEFLDMPQFYAGPANRLIKAMKDRARALRNWIQGRHHFVTTFVSTTT